MDTYMDTKDKNSRKDEGKQWRITYWKNWCRRSESNRHGVEAPRDFESENRLFANLLILKTVSLNHLKMQGKNLLDPIRSILSIPVYSGLFCHNFITLGIHDLHYITLNEFLRWLGAKDWAWPSNRYRFSKLKKIWSDGQISIWPTPLMGEGFGKISGHPGERGTFYPNACVTSWSPRSEVLIRWCRLLLVIHIWVRVPPSFKWILSKSDKKWG